MSGRALAAIVIILVGLLAVVVGVIYLTQPAHALPSFFPGHLAHAKAKHTRRGDAGVAVGLVLIIAGTWLAIRRPTGTSYYRES